MPKVQLQGAASKKQGKKGQGYQSLSIFRLGNCLLAGLGLLAGYKLIAPIGLRAISGALSAFCVCAGGNSINDLFDKQVDKINKPWRPLPMGLMSEDLALGSSVAVFGFGMFLGLLARPQMLLLAFIASYLLVIYSGWLKKYKFIGNIAISFLVGLLFIAGPLIAGNIYGGLNLAILAGVLNWAREILKDIEEKKKEQFILAEVIGEPGAKIVAAGLIVLCVIAGVNIGMTLPTIKAWIFYLAALIWVYGILRILSPHQAQKAIKYGMGLVVLALLLP